MYQHIQLRRLSNLSSNATSQKVDGLDAFKQKVASDIYGEDDVLVLKELSNKMDELEEVILVEDEPALRLPQLSNESWSDFVEELSKKYEHDDLLSTSVPQSTNAKRKFQIADDTQSTAHRCNVGTNDNGVVSISSDEDENSSTVILEEHMLSSSKDCAATLQEPTTAPLARGENNEGKEEINKLDSGQLNENCATTETESVNNEATQHSIEPISNINSYVAEAQNELRHNVVTASNNSTPCADKTLLEHLRSKTSNSSKYKGLTGINKKYQDIKRRTYKLTFHQILQIFDIEKSVPSTIGAIPGEPIELDFPELDMREFVTIVKNYQASECAEDVRHLWTQIKSWLSAMKPAYGTTTNYTKYQKKLNWYITELMAQYIKFEIENSIQNENYYKLKMEALMNTVSSLLNDDVNLKILTLLRTDFPDKPCNFLDDLFKKFLTHRKVRLENNDYGIYRLKVLAFQKWMHYSNRKKQDIVEIAIKQGSAYLPRLLPKNTEDPFYSVDRHVHKIDDYDKQGTRKILEQNISIDVLKATINKYLQVYESQLYDDFGYSLLRRQGLEHSQTHASREDAVQMQRHSPKAITVRSDARHCNRRRTHQIHMHNINNNNNSSRATHLPAGCDIQRRNRLSSSPFRINSCSCKSLVAKHQSDTSLSCKTPNSNDIISLDSTDDEDDSVDSAREITEKSSMNIEKRNQSTQQRIVRRVRPPLQPQTVDNRQTNTNTITQRTKPCQAHALRHNRQLRHKKVDTIVLDSSSSDGEETRSAPVNADEVNKHKIVEIDDTRIEEPNTPTAQPQQQTQQQQQQQAARAARLQSVSMPLRCALIGSVAIKPIRKEKHCIPGEVSSTTSHDINETERLNEAPAVSCSANLLVHNASAYENAREVGTVEILERRELRQPVVMSAERCFQPGKLLLGIDYSDDENEDDAAARSRENIAVGSEVGDDDDAVSNGCIIPMVGGYSKVVEEATSSTEVFQRIQSLENLENVAATEALSIVEPAPMVLAGPVERTAHVAAVSEDAPTCSKYANSNATVSKEDIQKECASASAHTLELKRGKSLKITVKDFASANIIGRGKDTPEERLREDTESAAPAFGQHAGLGQEDVQQQVNDKNEDEMGIKIVPLLAEEPTAINKEKHEIHTELTDSAVKNNAAHLPSEDDEMAAIDQMLADIDENLRVSHEFNEKYMKAKKNTAGVQSHNVAVQLTEHAQNVLDLTNTAVHNQDKLEKNAIAGNCEQIERAALAKTALTHTNNKDLSLDLCEPVSELAKSSDVDTEVETSVPVMETNPGELISVKPMKKLTAVEGQSLETTNDINTKETEEVNTMVRAESECLYKNNAAFEENSSYLVAACATKISKSTQKSCEEEAMVGNVQNNEEIESNQESDVLNDSCSRAVKTLAHLADNAQTNSRSEANTETEKRQLRDEDTTETDGLEKNALAFNDLQAKSIETDLNKSGLNEMNAEVEVEETDISTEVNAEERVNDMEVLVKPFEDVINGTALTLSVKNISSQIDMDQTEAAEMTVINTNITTNINKEIFEVENTNWDSQESTELVSSKTQANFVNTDLDTELAVSIERAENVDEDVHNLMKVSDISNDENVNTNKNAEAEKCELVTEMVLESRNVVDDTEDVDKYDSSKIREESEVSAAAVTENCNIENIEGYIMSADAVNCVESESIDKSTKTTSPKTISKDSDKCNELAFVENIENLHTDVTESFSEPSTPAEFVAENEMVSIDDIETLGMCKPVDTDIAEETVVTMKDVTETENETEATPLLENTITKEILSSAKEMRTVEPEPTVIETLALDLMGRDIEHHDSISRNIDEASVNKEELTKQSRRLVSCIEVASEMVELLTLPTKDNGTKTHKKAVATSSSVEELVKDTEQYNDETETSEMVEALTLPTEDNGSKPHEKAVSTSSSVEELVKDTEQYNDETETTSLLESSTIIQVNERQAGETESTDIETPMLVVKSQVMECHEVSDSVTRSNEEEPGNVIQLANENVVETETEPLETEGKINNSHEVSDLITNKIEELTVVTEEIVKAESHDETDETSLLESVTKFQVNERSSASADIKNKSPLQLEDVECAEISDPNNKGEQKVLVTDPRISNQDLPESVCIKIKEGLESPDVKTLPITHEIIVSAAKEIEEVVEEEIIEQLVETVDQLRVAQQEIGNNAEISTEVTAEASDLEITMEITKVTSVVPDDSIEETPSNRDDSVEREQLTELNDSQTEELDDGNASNKSLNTLMKNSSEHTTNVQTEIHESQKCKVPLANDFLYSEDEATDETPSEVEVKPDETNESSVIGTEVVESSAAEGITKSVAADVVEASTCSQEIASNERKQSIESQLEAVSEIEKITGSTIEPQEQQPLDEINSDETSVDFTEKFATECKVLPTESNDENSDQNANISEEKLKVIVEPTGLEVKEIPKERPSNNEVSESRGLSTGVKQVDETSSVQDLQVDEENIDNSTTSENEAVSLADAEESVEEAAITDAIVQAEVKELAITEDVPLEEGAEEPCLTTQYESDTSKIPVILTKTQNAEEKQVEIELNDENNSNLRVLKSDDVAECEHETADTNSLNNNNTSTVAIDTLLEDATARQLPSDSETVKTCSKQKLKLKSKPHKFIKIELLEKSTTSGSKKTSKLKVVRNSKKRLLTEDASGKLRFKRRVSPSNDSNKDLDKVEEFKKAEELADNIAKLVIKENVEVVENTIKQDNVTADTTEQSCSIKQDIDRRSLEDNTESTENQILDDINADETEQEMLEAEPELSEDCNSFQRLPSEYNSEEILAVTTLINMRNKYTSSTYMDEDNVVVEVPQEINRDEGTENIEAIVAPGSKKNSTKVGLVKKKVRFDEDNLLELMNEKYKALKKVKKSAKKVEKSRKDEGALLGGVGGDKKYVKRRLLELTTNVSTNEADHVIEHIEEVSDLKKKRGRKSSINAHEEQQLTHKLDELNDALKNESAVNNNPIYPVLLTSRRKSETTADTKPSKSTKNNTRSLKCDAPTISDIEYVGSDFIVPDDEVEPLCTETYEKPPVSKEKILKVSRVCVDGTKIKIKITPKEAIKDKEKPIIFEKRQEPETSVINKAEKSAIKEKISEQTALMKTRKVTVKLKRMKMPLYGTAIGKGSTFSSGAQSATLTDSEELDKILPESPTKFSKREESPTKYKKREEPRVILSESPTQSKKREDLDTILPESPTKFSKREESPTKYKKREEAKPILTESPTKSKKREELVTVLPESPTKFNKREESPTKYKKREEPEPNISESATKSKKREELHTILPESPIKFSKREESPTKYKKREEPRVILSESPNQSKKREELVTVLPESPTKFNKREESPTKYKKREEPEPNISESATKSKKREELVTVLPESLTKFNKREEQEPFVTESPTKYKKPKLETDIGSSELNVTISDELFIGTGNLSSKSLGKTSHRKHRANSPTKNKKSVKRDITSELAELLTIQDTDNVGRHLNAEPTNITDVSNDKLSPIKEWTLKSTSLENTGVVENANSLKNQDSSTKKTVKSAHKNRLAKTPIEEISSIKNLSFESTPLENTAVVENANSLKNQDSSTKKTVKSAHKNRLAKTPIEEISPIKNLSFESTSLENTAVVENANSLKNQDSSTKITVKSAHKNRLAKTPIEEISPTKDLSFESTSLENTGVADADPLQTQNSSDKTTMKHKKRLAKSSNKTKSLVLPTTCEDVPTSKEALNKESTTIRAAAMEKTTCMNKISTIEDVTNVQTPELSLSKDSPLAEPSSNKESNVSPEQSENMGIQKTKDSSTNITTKTSRKNRVVKSSFNIKLPIPSLTTKRVSKIKEEPTIKDSTITTTKIDTSIDETPIPKESTNKREPALQETSTIKQLRAAQQKLQLERLDRNHEEFKVANLSAEAVRITSETTTGLQDHILSEAEIKTEPLEDIQIKEEEDSCEAPLDMAQSYLNVDNRRHAKEFILKPCDVILTEAKINEQADAHRVFRKLRNKKSTRVVENTVPSTTNCNRFKARRNKASTTDVLKSAENVKTTENVIPTLEEVAQIKAMEEESNEQEMPKVQKELQTETIVEEMEKSKELQAETTKDDKKRSKVLQAETRKDDKKRSKVPQAETIVEEMEKSKEMQADTSKDDKKRSKVLQAETRKDDKKRSKVPQAETIVEDMEKSKELQAETTKDDKKRNKVLQAETRKDDKKRSKVPQAETIVEDMEKSKEMQAETTKDDKKRSKVLQAETRKDDKVENKDVNNSQTAVTVDNAIQQNAKPSKTDGEIEDHACSITDNVIAELKLLSPESLQNTEDDKEQIDLISCAENATVGIVVDTVKEQETQLMTNAESMCKVEKTDEEQKTALLLDSSIDIVLGNATFTKKPLTPKKNSESSAPETVVSNLLQNVTDSVAEVKKPDPNISANPPTKNRLDVLTAEKINSVLEKMLEQKNNLLRENKNAATMDAHVRPAIRRQTNTEEEGLRKSSNRNSLNSVKQISAKVPDALFADDESESSNADDSTSDEQFFAPILSLDDLLIKKDEPIADITHSYTPTQEQVVQETDAGQSHDGLGTPNFTVELEVETTQASDENSQSANGNQKVDAQSEESGKCVASEELNAHLEETDANFSLSAIADISTIDIPSDLNINNEYPDLLDAMLFEQVRQSIDCMISGTNSAKKWSQDSFATTQAAVNFNKAETAVRTDAPPSAPITQENDVIATNDKTVAANEEGIGIGQETFLGTISSLDEVEVPTTGFDLVGSFTIADFLSDAGSDLFAFPELDKTQSRSNSFSAESNLCETPPPPAIDTADEETSNDKKDECSTQTPTNQNTNSVACDHSYNKDINEVEKQRTKVRKKSTSSNTSTATALQSTAKSAASSPLNNADMLHVFSRAKCLPKPFWKVKRTEEIKTSTPKKEELTSNTQNTQPQTSAVAVKRTITLSPITVKNAEEKQTVFSMPALELVIEQNAQEEEITATSSNSALPQAITNTETETVTNLSENISKIVDDVTLPSQSVIETVKADGLEEVLPQMVPNSAECETLTPLTRPPKRTSTPIEITEVITIPAPLIVQPIIRIQSQTNRLERIDPSLSSSQQAFPLITPESQPNLTDAPNVSQIEVNDISRPERDSTPTLDEPSKDDYELSTPNNSLIVEASTHTDKARQSATELDEPPAKRLCVENVNKVITTNDIFDMLKSEEKSQKEAQLAKSSTNTTKTTDLVNTKIVDSKTKQIVIELSETKASDEHFNTDTEASNNIDLISSKVENKSPLSYAQSAQIEEDKKNSESSANNQQIVKKPVDITPIKQKYEKLSPSQEPILISKETLIALKQREHAAKNMSTIMITEHLQPLSPESTAEKCSMKIADIKSQGEKLKRSPARRIEESQEEKIAPITLKITKDILSQPNQSEERQQLRAKAVQCKNSSESSVTPVTPSADDHSSSARTNIVPSKKLKGSNASPVLSNASPCAKSNIDTNHNKTQEITNTHSPSKPAEKEDVRNTPPIKSQINMKIKELPIAEVINRSETKNVSPCQTATVSPRTRVPPKSILAVEPTLLPQNANRYHPYQRTQTPPITLNTHKSKVTPQRPQSRDSLPATPENATNKKRETPKSSDKTTPQRIASTVTTLPPLMQSRPTPSHQTAFGTPPTITDLASIKLTAEDEAEIARKLVAYRTTLPQAKTYGAHKENQRLVNLQEEKLRLEYAERASRRLRDTQRVKRKSQPETYESHYKKFAMHAARTEAPNSSNSSSSSSRSSGSASVGAGHHQSRGKQYAQQHATRPRPHHEYVNKFGEIEKLVEKEKVAKDTESKRSVPLTASTAWEPKMPTGDELIELLCKTKKS